MQAQDSSVRAACPMGRTGASTSISAPTLGPTVADSSPHPAPTLASALHLRLCPIPSSFPQATLISGKKIPDPGRAWRGLYKCRCLGHRGSPQKDLKVALCSGELPGGPGVC